MNLNIMDAPLPDDDIKTVFFTGSENSTWNDYHVMTAPEGGDVRLVVRDFDDWQQIEVFCTDGKSQLSVLNEGDTLPYDTIIATSDYEECHCVFGRSSLTGQAFVHRMLSSKHGLLLSL